MTKFELSQRVYVEAPGLWWHGKWGTVVGIQQRIQRPTTYTLKMEYNDQEISYTGDELRPEVKPLEDWEKELLTGIDPHALKVGDTVLVTTRGILGTVAESHGSHSSVRFDGLTFKTFSNDVLRKVPETP